MGTCLLGKCPPTAKCTWPAGAFLGYCAYPNSTVQEAEPQAATPLERVDVAWNITVACASLCQPDPEYSKTSYCTHKERGGCCVEVNPTEFKHWTASDPRDAIDEFYKANPSQC